MLTPSLTDTEILGQRLQADKAELTREFARAEPFRHVVIPDFFAPELAERLLEDFPAFEDRYAKGEMGKRGRKAARRNVREISDVYRRVDDFIQTSDFLSLMSEISGIPDLMYDSEYHGGGTHENVHGASLYTHVDFNYHPKGWHRRLNLIVYLSPEWEEEWGGSLELHSNPWDPSADQVKVMPTNFNQAVLFETNEHSWHGFPVIRLPEDKRDLSRKSFAIYLYTMDRPADQTAASHSTIYIPVGLPDDIQRRHHPDHRTGPRMLQRRFTEYRNMLKLQYDRQLHLSEAYEASYRMDLQGYAVQTRAPRGRFSDGWVTGDFSMEFTATKPVIGLRLGVVVPARMEADQTLEIRAGDWSGTESVPAGEERMIDVPLSVRCWADRRAGHPRKEHFAPGGGDTRELAYRIVSAALEH